VLLTVGLASLASTDGSSVPITITDADLLGGLVVELLLTATVGVWLWRSGWRPHRSATLPFQHQDLARGMALWVGAILAVALWAMVCRAVVPDLLAISKETQWLGGPSFWVSLSFSIYNAVFEELLWLGLGLAAFRRFGVAPAAAISIALRLLAHAYQGPLALVTVLPIGVLFTVYYIRTRRIWPIVVAHAFQDTLALTLLARSAGITAALAALAVIALTGSLDAQQVDRHVRLGVAATEARDLPAALRHFDAALAQDSMHYESNWRAALTLGLMGDPFPMSKKSAERDSLYSRAERHARRAVAANPGGADGHFALAASLGRAALMVGPEEKVRRAIMVRNEALRALAIDPRHDGAHHILGRWNAEIMRLPRLTRFFAKHFLGARIFDQASWQQATSHMERAVSLAPGRIYHHLALADIYLDTGRARDAEVHLRVVDSLPVREALDTNYRQQAADLRKRMARR
jgi:membrane protease YdiL (CAAX protease family)